MSNYPEITEQKIVTLLAVSRHGLSAGMGKPALGQMCVEHLANSVLYGISNEDPRCVDLSIRHPMFLLNDSEAWNSNHSRARGLRRPMIAQLGSAGIDRREFARLYAIRTVNVIIGDLCEQLGEHDLAEKCRAAKTLEEARDAAADAAARAVGDHAAYVFYAAVYAAYAADSAARFTNNESYLIKSGEIITQICIDMGTEGSKYLHLVDCIDKEQEQ